MQEHLQCCALYHAIINMSSSRTIICLLRNDLRLHDNEVSSMLIYLVYSRMYYSSCIRRLASTLSITLLLVNILIFRFLCILLSLRQNGIFRKISRVKNIKLLQKCRKQGQYRLHKVSLDQATHCLVQRL